MGNPDRGFAKYAAKGPDVDVLLDSEIGSFEKLVSSIALWGS
jgi:hypothetical protein